MHQERAEGGGGGRAWQSPDAGQEEEEEELEEDGEEEQEEEDGEGAPTCIRPASSRTGMTPSHGSVGCTYSMAIRSPT